MRERDHHSETKIFSVIRKKSKRRKYVICYTLIINEINNVKVIIKDGTCVFCSLYKSDTNDKINNQLFDT